MRVWIFALTTVFAVVSAISCFGQTPAGSSGTDFGRSAKIELHRLEAEACLAKAKATLVRAENDLAEAKMALAAYDEGDYLLQRQALESKLLLAQETLRRAQRRLAKSQAGKTEGQTKAADGEAEFACQQAKMASDQAKLKLAVLENYTRLRMQGKLKGRIAVAEAERAAAEADHRLWVTRVNRLKAVPAAGGSSGATSRSSQGAKDN